MKEGQKQDQQKNKNNMNVYKNKNNQRKITIPKKRVFQFKSNAQNDNK